jgi:hypothetical protein
MSRERAQAAQHTRNTHSLPHAHMHTPFLFCYIFLCQKRFSDPLRTLQWLLGEMRSPLEPRRTRGAHERERRPRQCFVEDIGMEMQRHSIHSSSLFNDSCGSSLLAVVTVLFLFCLSCLGVTYAQTHTSSHLSCVQEGGQEPQKPPGHHSV